MNISNLESNDKEGGLPPDAPKDLGQSSIYSLTFDEFQNNHRELGKDFGSLNMDTLLKNIWTAEDTQAVEACGVGKIDLHDASSSWIQRQGSITIPSTISQKTVDEVWRDLMRGSNGGVDESEGYNVINSQQQQQEPDLKEMTLEEFLLKAGVVQENITQTEIPMMPNCNNVNAGSTAVFGLLPTSDHQGNANVMVPNSFLNHSAPNMLGDEWKPSFAHPISFIDKVKLGNQSTLNAGLPFTAVDSPVKSSYANGHGKNIAQSGMSDRVGRVNERRQRRMIKNRESAARSRERKQAYTTRLETQVALLKEQNQNLQKKQEEMMETQKIKALEIISKQHQSKRPRCLRRTQTGPW